MEINLNTFKGIIKVKPLALLLRRRSWAGFVERRAVPAVVHRGRVDLEFV